MTHFPFAIANLGRKLLNVVKHFMHGWYDVFSIYGELLQIPLDTR